MRGALALSMAALAGGVAMLPRAVEACTCGGVLQLIRPLSGEHPAGAGLLFSSSCGWSLNPYAVTVDGAPATLAFDEQFENTASDVLVLMSIDPPPQPGQVVVLDRCEEDGNAAACGPGVSFEQVAQFTVGAVADAASPPAGGAASLVHEEGWYLMCSTYPLRFDVSLTELDQSGESEVLYVLEMRNSNGTLAATHAVFVEPPTSTVDTSIYLSHSPRDVEEYCVSVAARDLSGNSTLVAEHCGSESITPADSTGTDGDGGDSSAGSETAASESGTGEPASTSDTTIALDPGGSTTGEPLAADEISDRGCSCRAERRAGIGWWLVALAAVGVRRRSA